MIHEEGSYFILLTYMYMSSKNLMYFSTYMELVINCFLLML